MRLSPGWIVTLAGGIASGIAGGIIDARLDAQKARKAAESRTWEKADLTDIGPQPEAVNNAGAGA